MLQQHNMNCIDATVNECMQWDGDALRILCMLSCSVVLADVCYARSYIFAVAVGGATTQHIETTTPRKPRIDTMLHGGGRGWGWT